MSRSEVVAAEQSPDGSPAARWWLAVSVVVVLAVVFRIWHLSLWSLWEDEEATIHYALNPNKRFPSAFPIFFLGLRGFFSITGVSVWTARLFSVAIGLASLTLVFFCVRRLVGRASALLAVLFLALNLGHVFWSQSVRYYTLVFCFELLSLYCFYWGFERRRGWLLLLANVALVAAMLTHFSAVLLVPVFVAFLGLRLVGVGDVPRYPLRLYAAFGITLAVVMAAFSYKILALQGMMGSWALPSARDPLHVFVTLAAYFGAPLLVVALAGAVFNRRHFDRGRLLLLLLAIVPVLELIVIAALDVINVTWYYGFIAIVGFAVIAADWIVRLHSEARRGAAFALTGGLLAYSLAMLVMYQTIAYGDRPRWREAAD
jgi:4-amino-4-deoxy-L-arabinose transferase-like glycosyltransferase